MTQKKRQSHKTEDFGNSPFQALKKFRPPASPAEQRKPLPRPAQQEGEHEDGTLFHRAMRGVKRLGKGPSASSRGAGQKQAPAERATSYEEQDKKLFLNAVQTMGTGLTAKRSEPDAEETARPQPTNRMRLLKRGTIRISEELDLHGFVKEEALAALERFIAGASARGRQAVLVITGKGYNSPEGPVLQAAAADWLRRRGTGMVAEFAPAPRDRGGSGAYVVFLKKKQNTNNSQGGA